MVVDGLPVVPEDSKPKLVKFLVKQLNKAGKVKEDGFFMPVNNKGMTEGYDSNFEMQEYKLIYLAMLSSSTKRHSKPSQLPSKSTVQPLTGDIRSQSTRSQTWKDMEGKAVSTMNINHPRSMTSQKKST